MERFPGTKDYKLVNSGVTVTGSGTVTSGWIDVGEFAEQVDIILEAMAVATNDNLGLSALQSAVATGGTASSTLTVDIGTTTKTGQFKARLQTQYDDTSKFPWLGPVDGRYICLTAAQKGTNTTGTAQGLIQVLTLQSREYPVE